MNYIAHNAMLTEMIAADHDIIMALKEELKMTQEQMAELRELLLKSQQATEASRTNQSKHLAGHVSVSPAQSSL
jgi:DNA-binding XRE family transcriptional regulator